MKKYLRRLLWRPYQLIRSLVDRRDFVFRFHRRRDGLAPVKAWSSGSHADDSVIIDRVLAAYRLSAEEFETCGESMWQLFFDDFHKSIHNAIIDDRRNEIEKILRNPASSDLYYGFDNISRFLLSGRRLEDRNAPAQTLDTLIRLAEAIGVRRLENPETYSYKSGPSVHADNIVDLLENHFGFELAVPNPFPKEFGLMSKRGVMSYRVPQAIYQAWRISQLVSGIPNPKVLEIGGGLGRTALYCRQFGIKNYTIIDIPITAFAQGYFLGRVVGNDHVLLFGENDADAEYSIKILPPKVFLEGLACYDLIICADAMPEFDEQVARTYWSSIQKRSTIFLSINHESNSFTVNQLIAEAPNIGSVSRMPYWMRRGYLEETVYFGST